MISKTSAGLQIVASLFAVVIIGGLLKEMLPVVVDAFISICTLVVWLYLAGKIWSKTSAKSIEAQEYREKRKPVATWFIVAMLPFVAIIGFMIYLSVAK